MVSNLWLWGLGFILVIIVCIALYRRWKERVGIRMLKTLVAENKRDYREKVKSVKGMLEATRYMVTMPLLWSSVISQSTTYSNDVATSDDGTQMRRKINDAFSDATSGITAEQFALMKRSINNATNLHKQCLDDKRTIMEKFSIRKNQLVDQYGISQKISN